MSRRSEPAFIGLDLETTGLDERFDVILEIGIVLFDRSLRPLVSNSWVVKPRDHHPAVEQMGAYVSGMHLESGLSADLVDGLGQPMSNVSMDARQFIREHTDRRLPMLGSSVTFDRMFLAAHAPELLEEFHHRSLDATSVRLGALTQVLEDGVAAAELVIQEDTDTFRDNLLDELDIQPHFRKPHRPIWDLCTSAALIMASTSLMRYGL